MLEIVTHILQHNCLLDSQKPLVLGVSGGPDSSCLLDILYQAGYRPIVAHLNHGLRPSADDEEYRLKSNVGALGLQFVSKKIDIPTYSRDNGMSIEEGAREARYRFLFEQADRFYAQAVVVGHNGNDQVETVLMHLLRGAGLAGLRGMDYRTLPNAWSKEVPLVRPLLGVWREEILSYLANRELSYETDESNTDTSYYRNRIRQELIPYLKEYNPELPYVIMRMAELLRGEYEVVEGEVEAASKECRFQQGDGYVVMSIQAWRQQMVAIQRSLLRKSVDNLKPGLRDLDYAIVDRAVVFLNSHTTGKLDLISGITLILEPDIFYIFNRGVVLPTEDWPQLDPRKEYLLQIPGDCRFSNGWVLKAFPMTVNEGIYETIVENENPYRVYLNLEKLSPPLVVRGRKPGDRLQVLGMEGRSAKLSDLMINAKLPERVRNLWPIVLVGQEIIWVPGLRVGGFHRVTTETTQVACLELIREESNELRML